MPASLQHVSSGGNNANDGLTWLTPKRDISAAVKALPVVNAGAPTQRYMGRVEVANGHYMITNTIPFHAGLQIRGTGNTFSTCVLQLAAGVNKPMFSWRESVGYTDEGTAPPWTEWCAGASLENMLLVGSKGTNPTAPPLVRILNGGYTLVLRDLHLREAKDFALYFQRNMLAVHMERVSMSKCDGGAAYFRHDGTAHANVLWSGGEIDDCGLGTAGRAVILIRETGNPVSANNIFNFQGIKGESNTTFTGAQRFIQFTPHTSGGGQPVNINVWGCGANLGNTALTGDGFCYEAAGASPGANWTIIGSGGTGRYLKAFKSDKTKFVTPGARVGLFSTPF